MTVLINDICFLHIPKTGGNWVREVLRQLYPESFLIVHSRNISDPHIDFSRLRKGLLKNPEQFPFKVVAASGELLEPQRIAQLQESFSKLRYFAFVRHPVRWWESFWLYRQGSGWDPNHPIDGYCQDDNYVRFIEKVLDNMPGQASKMMREFIQGGGVKVDFVGRQENLQSDLFEILVQCGCTPCPKKMASIRPLNVSEGSKPFLPESLNTMLMECEMDIIREFYSGTVHSLVQRACD